MNTSSRHKLTASQMQAEAEMKKKIESENEGLKEMLTIVNTELQKLEVLFELISIK